MSSLADLSSKQNYPNSSTTMTTKVAVLTTPNQWFVHYAEQLARELQCPLFMRHEDIPQTIETVFILSYHRIIPEQYLKQHHHNLVIHAADLPQGKGWAPLTWQVLEGKNDIVFTLFEADASTDNGPFYLKKTLHLSGYELAPELRALQAQFCISMCKEYLAHQDDLPAQPQSGGESFYRKRTTADSQIDLAQTLEQQFNLLRTVDNDDYPAFFVKDGHKYILKIYHDSEDCHQEAQ